MTMSYDQTDQLQAKSWTLEAERMATRLELTLPVGWLAEKECLRRSERRGRTCVPRSRWFFGLKAMFCGIHK